MPGSNYIWGPLYLWIDVLDFYVLADFKHQFPIYVQNHFSHTIKSRRDVSDNYGIIDLSKCNKKTSKMVAHNLENIAQVLKI